MESRTIILKGTLLSSDMIVGASSMVTSNFKGNNVIIAGYSANIKKCQMGA